MSELHPLVKTFTTGACHYLYDGKTNRIIRISEVMFNILPLYGSRSREDIIAELRTRHTDADITEGLALVERLDSEFHLYADHGLRHRAKPPICIEEAQAVLETDIPQLVLEVTEACNFRCRYCVYSGSYGSMWRTHGSRHMSWEIARAAIDFYYSKSHEIEKPTIGFYGGEPLMRFDLIKKCVEYARALPWANPSGLHLSITTSGSLLTDEMMDFFVNNDFSVLISLDGPQREHDRDRILANGQGTFSQVFKRVQRFRERAPRFFGDRVAFSAVGTAETDMLAVNDFFVELQNRVNFTFVRPGHVDLSNFPTGSPADLSRAELFNRFCSTLAGLADHDLTFMHYLFDEDFLALFQRGVTDKLVEDLLATGACFPGKRKVFVTVDGSLHMCERISPQFPIGNVWRGFDVPRIVDLVNTFRRIMDSEECRNCWMVRFCPVCYTHLETNGGQLAAIASKKEGSCYPAGIWREVLLKAYCSVLERDPHAFDYMKNYLSIGSSEYS